MFTKPIVGGMNLLILFGFLVMGIGLTLHRQKSLGAAAAFGLMGAGTALVALGFYIATPAGP